MLSATTGATVSITNVLAELVPVLPATSDWAACAVYCAFAVSACNAVGVTDQLPPLSVVVNVNTGEPLTVSARR